MPCYDSRDANERRENVRKAANYDRLWAHHQQMEKLLDEVLARALTIKQARVKYLKIKFGKE